MPFKRPLSEGILKYRARCVVAITLLQPIVKGYDRGDAVLVVESFQTHSHTSRRGRRGVDFI